MYKDERVGTNYINFNEVRDKNMPLRWMNFYGPPIINDGGDNEYADLMTLHGDKGSTYRGRLLYKVSTKDDENPRTFTKELKFDLAMNPSPAVPVKSYLLKVALYEAVELPELSHYHSYSIVASCGPYEV